MPVPRTGVHASLVNWETDWWVWGIRHSRFDRFNQVLLGNGFGGLRLRRMIGCGRRGWWEDLGWRREGETLKYQNVAIMWGCGRQRRVGSVRICFRVIITRNFLKVLGFVLEFEYNFAVFGQIRIRLILLFLSSARLVF